MSDFNIFVLYAFIVLAPELFPKNDKYINWKTFSYIFYSFSVS